MGEAVACQAVRHQRALPIGTHMRLILGVFHRKTRRLDHDNEGRLCRRCIWGCPGLRSGSPNKVLKIKLFLTGISLDDPQLASNAQKDTRTPRWFVTRSISLEGRDVPPSNFSSTQMRPPRPFTWIQESGPPWLIEVVVWENLARGRRAVWEAMGCEGF